MDYISTPAFIIPIIKKVEEYINRSLTDKEENDSIKLIKNTNFDNISNISKQKISRLLIDTIIEDINYKHCSENVNIHELLLSEINETENNLDSQYKNVAKKIGNDAENECNGLNIKSIFGIDDMFKLSKFITEIGNINKPKENKEHMAYLFLDSKYRFLEKDSTECYKWGCVNSFISSQGTVNHNNLIKNIKSIEMTKFILPNSLNKSIFKYDRITTLIHEFESQSFIGHENRRFHFISQPEIVNDKIEIDPHYFHGGVFEFKDPITILDTITISFGNPLEKIKFDKDRLFGVINIEKNNVENNVENNDKCKIVIIFDEPHNLDNGDYIYIDTFDQYIKNKDLKNNYDYINFVNVINNSTGLQCYVKDSCSIYVFNPDYKYIPNKTGWSIEDDTNLIHINNCISDLMDLNCKYNIFFGSKRLFITLSITYS